MRFPKQASRSHTWAVGRGSVASPGVTTLSTPSTRHMFSMAVTRLVAIRWPRHCGAVATSTISATSEERARKRAAETGMASGPSSAHTTAHIIPPKSSRRQRLEYPLTMSGRRSSPVLKSWMGPKVPSSSAKAPARTAVGLRLPGKGCEAACGLQGGSRQARGRLAVEPLATCHLSGPTSAGSPLAPMRGTAPRAANALSPRRRSRHPALQTHPGRWLEPRCDPLRQARCHTRWHCMQRSSGSAARSAQALSCAGGRWAGASAAPSRSPGLAASLAGGARPHAPFLGAAVLLPSSAAGASFRFARSAAAPPVRAVGAASGLSSFTGGRCLRLSELIVPAPSQPSSRAASSLRRGAAPEALLGVASDPAAGDGDGLPVSALGTGPGGGPGSGLGLTPPAVVGASSAGPTPSSPEPSAPRLKAPPPSSSSSSGGPNCTPSHFCGGAATGSGPAAVEEVLPCAAFSACRWILGGYLTSPP
mmetsp:Transcript_32422/g.76957  ORF Transcript_32422/g.76957 Transcript_32422/m.76957 type:complete len:477 (+) Transcript_32422:457-1887(+)